MPLRPSLSGRHFLAVRGFTLGLRYEQVYCLAGQRSAPVQRPRNGDDGVPVIPQNLSGALFTGVDRPARELGC